MSSQEPPKKKSKRTVFCLYSECTYFDVMYFCASVHETRTKWKKTQGFWWRWTINKSVSARARAQSLNMHPRKTHLGVPHGGNNYNAVVYIGIVSNC